MKCGSISAVRARNFRGTLTFMIASVIAGITTESEREPHFDMRHSINRQYD